MKGIVVLHDQKKTEQIYIMLPKELKSKAIFLHQVLVSAFKKEDNERVQGFINGLKAVTSIFEIARTGKIIQKKQSESITAVGMRPSNIVQYILTLDETEDGIPTRAITAKLLDLLVEGEEDED